MNALTPVDEKKLLDAPTTRTDATGVGQERMATFVETLTKRYAYFNALFNAECLILARFVDGYQLFETQEKAAEIYMALASALSQHPNFTTENDPFTTLFPSVGDMMKAYRTYVFETSLDVDAARSILHTAKQEGLYGDDMFASLMALYDNKEEFIGMAYRIDFLRKSIART